MNRWAVYEWLKKTFMFSGRVPTRDMTYSFFRGLDAIEIESGITEFERLASVHVRMARNVGYGGSTNWIRASRYGMSTGRRT